MLEINLNQIPAISLLFRMSGWMVGVLPAGVTKTNSVQIQLNLPVGTELGKKNPS